VSWSSNNLMAFNLRTSQDVTFPRCYFPWMLLSTLLGYCRHHPNGTTAARALTLIVLSNIAPSIKYSDRGVMIHNSSKADSLHRSLLNKSVNHVSSSVRGSVRVSSDPCHGSQSRAPRSKA